MRSFDKVYVVTDRADCTPCGQYGQQTVILDDPAEAVESLLRQEENVALFVDVKFYLKLGAEVRNRLQAVAAGLPVFRIHFDRRSESFQFIDDPARADTPVAVQDLGYRLRSEDRVPVKLNALLAKEDDPFVQHAVRTNITNISNRGCFMYCVDNDAYRGFVFIRIQELTNKRPIYCSVRWRRPWGEPDTLPGLGLQFVDMTPDQRQELDTMYIQPHLLALDAR